MLRIAILFAILVTTGCARSCNDYIPQPPDATGGSPGTGGAPATGGAPGTGGSEATGGDQAAGGAVATRCPFVRYRSAARAAHEDVPKVIGGAPAPDGRFPAACSLQRGDHICTCFLVAPRVAVTAAHCGPRAGDRVIVGRIDLRNEAKGHVVDVESGWLHERYTSWRTGYDLALIKLADTVTGIQFAQLGSAEPLADVEVSGWGLTDADGTQTSPVLQYAKLRLEDSVTCAARWGQYNSSMLCASAHGADAASGDSGGPLWATEPGGRLVVVGAVSFGPKCRPTPDPDDIDPTCTGFYAEIASQAEGIRACIDGGL